MSDDDTIKIRRQVTLDEAEGLKFAGVVVGRDNHWALLFGDDAFSVICATRNWGDGADIERREGVSVYELAQEFDLWDARHNGLFDVDTYEAEVEAKRVAQAQSQEQRERRLLTDLKAKYPEPMKP
jgi:hypothetical protein